MTQDPPSFNTTQIRTRNDPALHDHDFPTTEECKDTACQMPIRADQEMVNLAAYRLFA